MAPARETARRRAGVWRDPAQGRLRAGWRILAFLSVFVALNGIASLLVRVVLGGPPRDPVLRPAAFGALVVGTATLAVWACRRYLDRRSLASLGLRWSLQGAADLVFGFALSGTLVAAVFFALRSFGWLELRGTEAPSPALTAGRLLLLLFGVGVAVGWWEELVFRGYLLQNLRDGVGLSAAVALSCVVYGLVHLGNPSATPLSALLIALIGYSRIYGWLCTGRLWLSMGMHAGWNFFQGPVFGFPVSGRVSPALLSPEVRGPSWIGGGPFGPEAGLVVVPAVLLGLVAMGWWARRGAPRTGAAPGSAAYGP